MAVADGQIWVIKKLAELGKLFYKTTIKHSYPHCWRCRGGLIFRATSQWFCNLAHQDLQLKARAALDQVNFVPERAGNNLKATIDNRLEWCLSRQRVWGVPIPALLCQACDHAYLTAALVEKVAAGVAQVGVDYWETVPLTELLPTVKCLKCGNTELRKEQDILDVWFDSGVSHYAVLAQNPALGFPADVYLEGRDQARGWFQSSLLTSLVIAGQGNTKTIITHGYTVDAQGRKMSKSLGNGVEPQQLIAELGTDGLRLWAAASDLGNEVAVAPALLNNVKEVYRKLRNTARFLLSNLADFNPKLQIVRLERLQPIDQYALYELAQLQTRVLTAYAEARFTVVFAELAEYCTKNLSACYLDVIKDRLYVEQHDSLSRQAAQTTCWVILDTLTKLMAPILSFTAEQLSDHYQRDKPRSIHLQNFNNLDFVTALKLDPAAWQTVLQLRSAILQALEVQRAAGVIKHSLEAEVQLQFATPASATLYGTALQAAFGPDVAAQAAGLKALTIVSQVGLSVPLASDLVGRFLPEVALAVQPAAGTKCPRCWHYTVTAHADQLCARCEKVVAEFDARRN